MTAIARAIATIDFSAAGSVPTRASGSMPPPMRSSASLAAAARAAPGDQPAAARIAGEHRDVLGHGHRVDQAEILMDEGDRQLLGDRIDRAAAQPDLAAVGAVHARQDLDQRRLAGAVLAQQSVDLAGPHLEVDGIERERAGEALGQPPDLEQRWLRLGHGPRQRRPGRDPDAGRGERRRPQPLTPQSSR